MTVETVEEVGATSVDYLSGGGPELNHTVASLDTREVAMKFVGSNVIEKIVGVSISCARADIYLSGRVIRSEVRQLVDVGKTILRGAHINVGDEWPPTRVPGVTMPEYIA